MTKVLKIHPDPSPESPREWSNVGTMIAFHTRYSLGDTGHGFRSEDYESWDDMERAILKEYGRNALILPLYLYDHSGITMNTTGFHCPWDSGRVGFIVASAAKAREEYGFKVLTAKRREQALNYLKGEVEVYAQYLEGDVYYFTVEENGEVVDSCGGFYGSDPKTNGMADHVDKELVEAFTA